MQQNIYTWKCWEEIEDSFMMTFCKTVNDPGILRVIFDMYQERKEDPHQFVKKVRNKFGELNRQMSEEEQINMIMSRLDTETQRELNTMPLMYNYRQLAEAISVAETRLSNMKKVKDVRKPVRRLRDAKDSVLETSTVSESESEPIR